MKITKPNMTSIWAEGGSVAVVPSEKISQGWVVEIPPCEQMNFVQNRQDSGIAYLMQQGIPEWDSLIEYQTTSYVQNNGVVYKALGINTNKSPTSFPEFWGQAFDEAGSAQSVQDQLDAIEADADPFTQYLLKERAVANGIDAALSVTNILTAVNLNIVDDVGEYYIGEDCVNSPFLNGVMKVWVETFGLATYQLVQSFTGQGIATRFRSNAGVWTAWAYSVTSSEPTDLSVLQDQVTALSESLAAVNEATRIKVGQLFLTVTDFLAPSEVTTFLGYGTWVRYAEGRALVGKSTLPLDPAWTKVQNSGFGEYDHTLTLTEMPSHNHTKNPDGSVEYVNVNANGGLAGSYATGNSYIRTHDKTGSTGGSQSHNNVQPSLVVGIWYRSA